MRKVKVAIIVVLSILLIIGVGILIFGQKKSPVQSQSDNTASNVTVRYVNTNVPVQGGDIQVEITQPEATPPAYERNEAGVGYVDTRTEGDTSEINNAATFADFIVKVNDEQYRSWRIPDGFYYEAEVISVLSYLMDSCDYKDVAAVGATGEPIYDYEGNIIGISQIILFDCDGVLYMCLDDTTSGATIEKVSKEIVHSLGESMGVDLSKYE